MPPLPGAARVKDTLKTLDDFKNKRNFMDECFLVCIRYVFSESIFNALYIEIKHKC